VEYFDQDGDAVAKVEWESEEVGIGREVIPISAFIHHEACDCKDLGFVGDLCEKNVNDCAFDPCENGGTCVDGFRSFKCICPLHFNGNLCENQSPEVCLNGGVPKEVSLATGLKISYTNFDSSKINTPSFSLPQTSNAQTVGNLNYDWADGSPFKGIQSDGFTGRWEGALKTELSGLYNFTFKADDGIIVYFSGVKIIDAWNLNSKEFQFKNIFLDSNTYYDFEVQFFEKTGFAKAIFEWESQPLEISQEPVPISSFVHRSGCECSGTGFTGDQCEIQLNDCASDPCKNGGTCVDGIQSFSCLCLPTFSGDICEHSVNISISCLNGGTLNSENAFFQGLIGKYYLTIGIDPYIPTSTDFTNIQRIENINIKSVNDFPPGVSSNQEIKQYILTIWEGFIKPTVSGNYIFLPEMDDRMILYIQGQEIFDYTYQDTILPDSQEKVFLDAGVYYEIKVVFWDIGGPSKAILNWQSSELGISKSVVPFENFYHTLPCNCANTGFVGAPCDLNINDCASNPCSNDQTCVDEINGFTCLSGTTFETNGLRLKRFDNYPFRSQSMDDIFPLASSNGIVGFGDVDLNAMGTITQNKDYFQFFATGLLKVPTTGMYQFSLESDDGSRLYLSGVLVIDAWLLQVIVSPFFFSRPIFFFSFSQFIHL